MAGSCFLALIEVYWFAQGTGVNSATLACKQLLAELVLFAQVPDLVLDANNPIALLSSQPRVSVGLQSDWSNDMAHLQFFTDCQPGFLCSSVRNEY